MRTFLNLYFALFSPFQRNHIREATPEGEFQLPKPITGARVPSPATSVQRAGGTQIQCLDPVCGVAGSATGLAAAYVERVVGSIRRQCLSRGEVFTAATVSSALRLMGERWRSIWPADCIIGTTGVPPRVALSTDHERPVVFDAPTRHTAGVHLRTHSAKRTASNGGQACPGTRRKSAATASSGWGS
jgi:hypothetical protein